MLIHSIVLCFSHHFSANKKAGARLRAWPKRLEAFSALSSLLSILEKSTSGCEELEILALSSVLCLSSSLTPPGTERAARACPPELCVWKPAAGLLGAPIARLELPSSELAAYCVVCLSCSRRKSS